MKTSSPDNDSLNGRRPPSRWRLHVPKALFAGACLATVVAAFVVLKDGHLAQAQVGSTAETAARAERAAAYQFIPPPVPDHQNFASTPLFASLFDRSPQASRMEWPEKFTEADRWARRWPVMAESEVGRKTGRLVTDHLAWQRAFEQARTGINDEEIVVLDRPHPATNRAAALVVLRELAPYEPILRQLAAARTRPFSRFPVQYEVDNPWTILLPHLAVLKRTSQLLRLKASAEIAAGNPGRALEDVLLLLRLVESCQNEPTLISQLVRAAIFEIAMQPLWEGLAARCWSDSQLKALQAELHKPNFIADLRLAYEAERAWCNLTIALMRDRHEPGIFQQLISTDQRPEEWLLQAEKALLKAPREWFELERRNCERLFETRLLVGFDARNRTVSPREAEENGRSMRDLLNSSVDPVRDHLVFAKLLLLGITKVHPKLAYSQNSANLAAVACAVERFRLARQQYPARLADLTPTFIDALPVDVTTGESLKYSSNPTGDEFLLYSVGWNVADEQGRVVFLESGRGVERNQGDWVWRYPEIDH